MPGSVFHLRSTRGGDRVLSAAVSNVDDAAAEVVVLADEVVPADAVVAAGWFHPARTQAIRMRRKTLDLSVAAMQDCLVSVLQHPCHMAFVHQTKSTA